MGSCFGDQELIYTLATWAGHLNSLLNPIIYPRFSREFRRAFKQILTCKRKRSIRSAMKTTFDLVFAQLVAILHFWDTTRAEIYARTEKN
ncbi:unnamed protein product [Gongylonema pulchrum]|uniref:G_PROTEIN_RECEP_F1_2 domain-containing protein n=1 Tax=Gongylonema pulchrum TaxID=637853 RepID=A0A183EH61_9BILA|nr:unnamed protein product [Gongylonema pulchrum]